MRRYLHWLFAPVSLVLCMAIAMLWARSYRVDDGFAYARAGSVALGRSHSGRIAVITRANPADSRGLTHFRANPLDWEGSPPLPRTSRYTIFEHKAFLGFAYMRGTQSNFDVPDPKDLKSQWNRSGICRYALLWTPPIQPMPITPMLMRVMLHYPSRYMAHQLLPYQPAVRVGQ